MIAIDRTDGVRGGDVLTDGQGQAVTTLAPGEYRLKIDVAGLTAALARQPVLSSSL